MTMEIVGNDAQFNEKVTLLKDLEIYGDIKNKTNDTSLDFSDNLSFKIQGNEKLRITSDDVTISAQSLNIESVSTFNDDVVFAGAAYNMKWDHSTNDLILFDNTRLEFGSNKDFEIWHGGSHTFLKNSGGDLRIRGDKILLKRADGTERYLEANVNSEVKLFFNGDEKFETTNTGVVVTGKVGISSAIPDSMLEVTGIDPAMTVHHPTQSRGGIVGLSTQRVAFFSTNANDDLIFGHADNPPSSDNFVEHMRIDNSTGRVGINSSIPAATLDIHDIGSTGPNLLLRGGSETEGDIVVPDGEALQFGHWNYGTNTFTERYRYKSNGHLFINTTINPNINAEAMVNMVVDDSFDGVNIRHNHSGHCINIWRANGNGSALEFYRNDGSQGGSVGRINLTTTGVDYVTGSDYRLKENAVGITSAITRLKTLKPYRFNFINEPTKTVDGFFAHEVTAVPEAVTGTKDEVDSDNNPVYQGIDQSKLVPLLTAALQEAVAKIETLEAKVAALESA